MLLSEQDLVMDNVMRKVVLVVIAIWCYIDLFIEAKNPGCKLKITQKGLDYGKIYSEITLIRPPRIKTTLQSIAVFNKLPLFLPPSSTPSVPLQRDQF